MKFVVRVIVDGKLKVLGTVRAKHQPAAVIAAWAKWPQHVRNEVQGGFSVVVSK